MNPLTACFQPNHDGEPEGFHFSCLQCAERVPLQPDEGLVHQLRLFLDQHQHD
ncbi:MAG: hypothetical protein QOE05_2946 [Actinomycetota bacterium]|nr:hypothetical protein [Actinomycetota bacterium]